MVVFAFGLGKENEGKGRPGGAGCATYQDEPARFAAKPSTPYILGKGKEEGDRRRSSSNTGGSSVSRKVPRRPSKTVFEHLLCVRSGLTRGGAKIRNIKGRRCIHG